MKKEEEKTPPKEEPAHLLTDREAEEASQPLPDEKVEEASGGYYQRPAWLPDMSHDEKVY